MPRGVFERPSAEQRFWKYVNKETGSDCWEWTSHLDKDNYGVISVNRKNMKAHRFSYQLHYGEIACGMFVLHSCDNPKCIRPDHLSIGTCAENNKDRNNKNRQAKGSSNGSSKLNEELVIEIRNKLNLGIRQIDIAKEYDIGQTVISCIKTGKTWKHVNI